MGEIQTLSDYLAEPQDKTPDVVVIGSGPAGYFAALRLLRRGLRIVLLDAGNQTPDLNASAHFDLADTGFPPAAANLGLSWQVGGASNLWAGRVAPLEARDMRPEFGWPFGLETLQPYYDEAAAIIGVSPMSELADRDTELPAATPWGDLVRDPAISVKKFEWSTPPFNTRTALVDALAEFSRLTVVTDARVLAFGQPSDDGRVASVRVATPDGGTAHIAANAFVLAAGGIESPRILLNSGAGIGHPDSPVGAFLSTHPKMNIGTLTLNRPISVRTPLFSDVSRDGANLRFGLGLEPAGADEVSMNHYVQFSRLSEKIGTYAIEQAQKRVSGRGTKAAGFGALTGALVGVGRVVFNAMGRVAFGRKQASRLTLRLFMDQHPDAGHKVTLSDEPDRYGMPKALIQWDLTEDDIASVRRFVSDLSKLFESHQVGTLHLTLPEDHREWPMTSIHSHFMGTLRMGTDPASSVTDPDGRLHNVANVYVCGSAVFPSYGYANPFLTIAAMSLRTADRMP